jgi:MFS family permease
MFYTYLSIYLREFLGLSVTETTLFASLPMIVNSACQLFLWGIISDKYQLRRTLVIIGEISAGFSTLLVFFAHRMVSNPLEAGWVIILGLSGVEFFWSMSNTGWSALISDLYEYETRQEVQGQLSSIGGIGRIIGILIGGALYDGLTQLFPGWGFYDGPLFFIAAFVMFISTIPMLFIPEGGVREKIQSEESTSSSMILTKESRQERKGSIFVVFLLAMIFINFGRNSLAVIFSPYMVLDSGFNMEYGELGLLLNFQSVGIIVVGLLVGRMGSKIGDGYSTLVGAGTAIVALVIIAFSTYLPLIYLASVLRGVGDVIVTASSYAFVSELIPEKQRAKGFSIFNTTFFLSWGLAGTFLTGPIIDTQILSGVPEVLAYRYAFFAATVVLVIGVTIFTALLWKVRPQRKFQIISE